MEQKSAGKRMLYTVGTVLLLLILAMILGIMTGVLPWREGAGKEQAEVTDPPAGSAPPQQEIVHTPSPDSTPDLSGTATVPEMTLTEEEQVYTVTVTCGKGGTVSPSGMSTVVQGGSMSITILPENGYMVEDVTLDGISVGAGTTLTLNDVQSNHGIYVSFIHIPDAPETEPPQPQPSEEPVQDFPEEPVE